VAVPVGAGRTDDGREAAREQVELQLLLEGIHLLYGYDFRDYASSSVLRRVRKRVHEEGVSSISALQERVLRDGEAMRHLLRDLSITVTAMFRDPGFYLALRRKVVPILRTYPYVRIWHAGCSTGEEVHSLAVVLHEEGLYERCRIYATDISEEVLEIARRGIYPLRVMREYTQNYLAAGGTRAFSDYYTAKYDNAQLSETLRRNVVFAQHNLAMDGAFNEFNLVFCRNVMIYFNKGLQARVHDLLHESLVRFGILGLGSRETIRFTPHAAAYKELDGEQRIYQRVA
jgi:chemotaxis protein methyltransferase CheR